jgi:hypothetical protein
MFLGVDDALETTIDFSFEIWFFFEKFWKKMKKIEFFFWFFIFPQGVLW